MTTRPTDASSPGDRDTQTKSERTALVPIEHVSASNALVMDLRRDSTASAIECIVCMDSPRSVVLPCGHANLCQSCLARLGSHPRCPTCRAPTSTAPTHHLPEPVVPRGRVSSRRAAAFRPNGTVSAHTSFASSSVISSLSSVHATRSTSGQSTAPRVTEAEIEPSSLALCSPISGPAAGRPRLVLLMGARGVPLAALATRLAATSIAESTAVAAAAADSQGGQGATSHSVGRRCLRFAFLVDDDSSRTNFEDAVQRIRACSPSFIVLCAHADRPVTFEHLVKTDLALCAKFGRAAPRSWALIHPAWKSRLTQGTSVDPPDVQNALHYLGLGATHVRDTFSVTLGKNPKEVRLLHRAIHDSVFRRHLPLEVTREPLTVRRQVGPVLGSISAVFESCYLRRSA